MLVPKGTKAVLRGTRLGDRGAGIPFNGMEMSANASSRQQSCGTAHRFV